MARQSVNTQERNLGAPETKLHPQRGSSQQADSSDRPRHSLSVQAEFARYRNVALAGRFHRRDLLIVAPDMHPALISAALAYPTFQVGEPHNALDSAHAFTEQLPLRGVVRGPSIRWHLANHLPLAVGGLRSRQNRPRPSRWLSTRLTLHLPLAAPLGGYPDSLRNLKLGRRFPPREDNESFRETAHQRLVAACQTKTTAVTT